MDNRVLITGDSWAELAEEQLQDYCNDTVVEQLSQGGLTAVEMKELVTGNNLENLVDVAPNHIWLSIGGNDFLDAPGCNPNIPQIQNDVETIINTFLEKYPSATLLVTGYGLPSQGINCNTAEFWSSMAVMYDGLNLRANAKLVTILDLFGGSIENNNLVLSDEMYFEDPIHLNSVGYEKLFTHPPVAAALGCIPQQDTQPTSAPTQFPTVTPVPTQFPTFTSAPTDTGSPTEMSGAFSRTSATTIVSLLLLLVHLVTKPF